MATHSVSVQRKNGGFVLLVAGPPDEGLRRSFFALRAIGCTARFDDNARSWLLWLPYGGAVEFYSSGLYPLRAVVDSAQWECIESALKVLQENVAAYEKAADGWVHRLGPLVESLQSAKEPLEDYQTQGAYLLGGLSYGLLNDEQGMGKSRTIAALLACLQTWPAAIVTKASCLYNWPKEIRAVAPSLRVEVLGSTSVPSLEAQIYVLSYNILEQQARLTRRPLGVTIFDESQEMIGRQTTRGIWSVVFAYAAQRCYLVSGTPMPSRPRDVFHQLRLLRSPVTESWRDYAEHFCAGKDITKTDPETNNQKTFFDTRGASHMNEFAALIGALTLRRTKKEFLSLPPKIRSFRRITLPLDSPYWKAHQNMRKARGDVAKLKAISLIISAAALAKVPETACVIREKMAEGLKIVVFSGSIAATDALAKTFPDALRLKGGTPPKKRKQIQDEFQSDPKRRLIICALKSSGAGINLQSASVAVINDLPWSPDITHQAEDRIHRIGSLIVCQIIYVMARHSFDDVIMSVLTRKRKLQEAIDDWTQNFTAQRTEQSMLFA